MKFLKLNKGKGFTLIEALVTIFIVGLISSIVVTSWRKNEKQYQLKMAAQKIVQDVRKAQEMSLGIKQYPIWFGVFKPVSFGLYFTTGTRGSYIIFADSELLNDKVRTPIVDRDVESVSILQNIEIDSLYTDSISRSQVQITFSIPDGFTTIKDGTWLSPGPDRNLAAIRIRFKNSACPKYCKDIIISRTGQVSVQ
jgi:prepilin-type N-terminal cleavage/methylation domain-containing protein